MTARKSWIVLLVLGCCGTLQAGGGVPPDDPNIHFRGAKFFQTLEDGGLECNRFPVEVLKNEFTPRRPKPDEAWGGKARTTTGVKMIFKTDSKQVVLHFEIPEKFMNRGANWLVLQNGRNGENFDFQRKDREMDLEITSKTPGKPVVYTVVYPSWANPVFRGMELDKGKKPLPYSPPKKPLYVAYGDSVSHGTGQKSAAYLTWPYKLAEMLDYDYYSLAVGGAKIGLPVVECFQYFDHVDLITFYLGINDAASKTVEEYEKDYGDALGVIRKYHPQAKIFCITLHTIPEDKMGRYTKIPLIQYRQPVVDVVAARQKAGDKNLFLVDGTQLVGLEDAMNPGNVHLSIDGADKWAKKIYQKITQQL